MGSGETLSPTYVDMYRASITCTTWLCIVCRLAFSLVFRRIVLTNLNEFLRTIRVKIVSRSRDEQQASESKALCTFWTRT